MTPDDRPPPPPPATPTRLWVRLAPVAVLAALAVAVGVWRGLTGWQDVGP